MENYLDNLATPDKQSNDTKIIFASFDSFKDAVMKIYGDPDQYKKATVAIQRLQQIHQYRSIRPNSMHYPPRRIGMTTH